MFRMDDTMHKMQENWENLQFLAFLDRREKSL